MAAQAPPKRKLLPAANSNYRLLIIAITQVQTAEASQYRHENQRHALLKDITTASAKQTATHSQADQLALTQAMKAYKDFHLAHQNDQTEVTAAQAEAARLFNIQTALGTGILAAAPAPQWLWFSSKYSRLAIIFFPLCLIWRNRILRRNRQRAANNICINCGYDLRATPNRCPECGSPAPTT